jgi:hypothetical protein
MRVSEMRSKDRAARGRLARVAGVAALVVCASVCAALLSCSAALAAGPLVVSEWTARIGTAEVGVRAVLDTEAAPVNYWVEYGSSESYGSQTATSTVPAASKPTTVTVSLEGLAPGSEYHWRLVAEIEGVAEAGPDESFSTHSAGLSGLPDGRVYEMVTSAENPYNSEVYESNVGVLKTSQAFESSVSGDAIVYPALPGSKGSGRILTGSATQEYLATRSPGGGWTQANISPVGAYRGSYEGFSTDLTQGVVDVVTASPFVPTESFSNPHSQKEEENQKRFFILYQTAFEEDLFRPVITTVTQRIEEPTPVLEVKGNEFSNRYDGASVDFRHLVFEANEALLEGQGGLEQELDGQVKGEVAKIKEAIKLLYEAEASGGVCQQVCSEKRKEAKALEAQNDNFNIYIKLGGQIGLVNVLPDGRLAVGVKFDGISADGSRVFWTDDGSAPGIYVQENGSRTVQVAGGAATYETASVNGSVVYYVENGDLWRFDVESEMREEVAGEASGVRRVIGVNQDGQEGAYVYFTATGVLTGEEENAEGRKPQEGAENVYISEPDPAHPGGHVTRFVATVDPEQPDVAPDGHSLVFASSANLLGRPYADEGAGEVYDYRVADGRLFCVSCRPQASEGILEPTDNQLPTRRWVSEDGDQVFFESDAPLVPQDVNDALDVYEWEPDGVGSCGEGEGCVYMLSDGLEAPAYFVAASPSGNDAFIATRQRLTPEDQGETVELYDARVGGALPVSPPQCTGTGCQGVPSPPPIFATPASVTFNGVGNFPAAFGDVSVAGVKQARALTRTQKLKRALSACRKKRDRRRVRTKCEARAHKLYAAKTGKG